MKTIAALIIVIVSLSKLINAQEIKLGPNEIDSLFTTQYYTYLGNNEFTTNFRSPCYIPWVGIKLNEISYEKGSRQLHLRGKVINENGKEYEIPFARIIAGDISDTETVISGIYIGDKKIDYGNKKTGNSYFHPYQVLEADKDGEFDITIEVKSSKANLAFLFPETAKGAINSVDKDNDEPGTIMAWVKIINIGEIYNPDYFEKRSLPK